MSTAVLTLTLDAALLAQAEAVARAAGTNLDELVRSLLAQHLGLLGDDTAPILSQERFDALSGSFRLPAADDTRPYRDLALEERARKYDRL